MPTWIDTLLQNASPAAVLLYQYMSDISEGIWCAGWLTGTEYACWEAVLGIGEMWGIGEITQDEANTLRRLSDEAGGWWHWPQGAHEPKFVTLAEWERIYAEHVK